MKASAMMLWMGLLLALRTTVAAEPPGAKQTPIIQLTDAAAKEIKTIVKDQAIKPGWSLRVGVKKGPEQGLLSYVLDLTEDSPATTDEAFTVKEIRVLVDEKSVLYLKGTTIDFQDNEKGRGFVFQNPNAKENPKK